MFFVQLIDETGLIGLRCSICIMVFLMKQEVLPLLTSHLLNIKISKHGIYKDGAQDTKKETKKKKAKIIGRTEPLQRKENNSSLLSGTPKQLPP
jgi:hypothetical protein